MKNLINLPNFLVIGAAKSGTTSLYYYLNEHAEIYMSPIKELSFFAFGDPYIHKYWPDFHFPVKTLEEYSAQFSQKTIESAIGEVSPIYLESRIAPTRIIKTLPHVKLIASLRNPADRAFSGYLMQVRKGQIDGDIKNAFQKDSRYVQGGFYHAKLRRYYDLFDSSMIKICLFEELKSDPITYIHDIYDFLGVDNTFIPDIKKRYNVGGLPKSKHINTLAKKVTNSSLTLYIPRWARVIGKKLLDSNNTKLPPDFPSEIRTQLINLYRDDILRLQDLVDKDLSIWFEKK